MPPETTADLTILQQVSWELDRELTPDILQAIWRTKVVPGAVETVIRHSCFGADPDGHAVCLHAYATLQQESPATLYDEFYCRGLPAQCGKCGHTWYGKAVPRVEPYDGVEVDAEAATWYAVGETVENRCPLCLTEYDVPTLQMDNWRHALATVIAEQAMLLRNQSKELVRDWTLRLATWIQNAHMVAAPRLRTWKDFQLQAKTIRGELQALGIYKENTKTGIQELPTWVYDEVNWVVYAPKGFEVLGHPDWREYSRDWSRNMRQDTIPLLMDAVASWCNNVILSSELKQKTAGLASRPLLNEERKHVQKQIRNAAEEQGIEFPDRYFKPPPEREFEGVLQKTVDPETGEVGAYVVIYLNADDLAEELAALQYQKGIKIVDPQPVVFALEAPAAAVSLDF